MMEVVFLIAVFFNTLAWVTLWQRKEYRFDRLFAHLKETVEGRRTIFSPFATSKLVLIFCYLFVVFNKELFPLYTAITAFVFTVEVLWDIRLLLARKVKRPILTAKSVLLVLVTMISLLFVLQFPLLERPFFLIVLDRFAPFFLWGVVFLLTFPTEIYWDLQIEKAIRLLRLHKQTLVIGVTGSYGKSSTKEYIAQILAKKFVVLSTPGSQNTPIGIARTVIESLTKSTEVFVVEMGAYKRGEIATLAAIVTPKIGIITGISHQHYSLFRNLKNVAAAKYELIEALPKNGLALFNGNSEETRVLYEKTKIKKALYEMVRTFSKNLVDIVASNVRAGKSSVSFDVTLQDTMFHFQAPLLGAHSVLNILPGIYIASWLGMNMGEIREAVASLSPLPHTMIRQRLRSGATAIDDTFSVNSDAVLAVVDYMKTYKGKRVLVLQPLIELGKTAGSHHYRIGFAVGRVCDYLFLTNNNFIRHVTEGVRDAGGGCMVKVAGVSEIALFVKELSEYEDIVVFEGREAGVVLRGVLA